MHEYKIVSAGFKALALLAFAFSAQATNLVTNGDFSATTGGTSGQLGHSGFNATDWTISGGYSYIFNSGTADISGSNGQYGNLKLWGPNTGSNNGLTASSPNGGNFVATDSSFQMSVLYQSVNVTAGQTYNVSFYQAAAQQSGYSGNTKDYWQVTLGGTVSTGNVTLPDGSNFPGATIITGGQSKDSSLMSIVSHGFSGWQQQTVTFTAATTGSELLGFLAVGSPQGVPPFALLDGVSMTVAAPEPETLALFGIGLLGMLAARRQQKNLSV